jgi:hypothetical protein
MIGGKCTWTNPHQRIRVNAIYEIVEAAGFQTACTDKHPEYDMVRGPSGKGLSGGYFPEILLLPVCYGCCWGICSSGADADYDIAFIKGYKFGHHIGIRASCCCEPCMVYG